MAIHLLLAFLTALEQIVHFFSLWEPFCSMLLYHRALSSLSIFRWLYWRLSIFRQALYSTVHIIVVVDLLSAEVEATQDNHKLP